MAAGTVQVLGFDGNPFDQRSIQPGVGRFIRTLCMLKILAGSYVAGGLTLDFTNGGGTPTLPTTVPPGQSDTIGPDRADVSDGPVIAGGILANGGNYVLIKGTNPTNWKIKMFATAGTEYAVGALGADALTDTPILSLDWAR